MTKLLAFDADQDVSGVVPRAKAVGIAAAARYLKNLSAAEVRALSAAGIKIISIYESTARRALDGAMAGRMDGEHAVTQAKGLGQPAGSAIYATVDFDAVPLQIPTVLSYLAYFRAALGNAYRLGVYGNGLVCKAALDGRLADYTWLAGGLGMQGSRDFLASGRATLVQDVGDAQHETLGIAIDSDTINADDFGGWLIPVPATVTIPPVRGLQEALVAEGLDPGPVDGVFGPRTQAALAEHYKRS